MPVTMNEHAEIFLTKKVYVVTYDLIFKVFRLAICLLWLSILELPLEKTYAGINIF